MVKSIAAHAALLLASISLLSSATHAAGDCGLQHFQGTYSKYSVYQSATYPQLDPNYDYGLMTMPRSSEVCAATETRLKLAKGVTLPVYETSETQEAPEKVKRVVIVLPAKGRDSWNYMNWMRNSRNHAASNFKEVKKHEIAVLSAQFFQQQDYQAGGAKKTDIRWLDDNSWSDGGAAQYPEGTKAVGMSSFEVLDWLSDHALKKYHNAESLVISGHSMGGQLAQRYAFLGKGIKSNVKVSYFMGNPGSYLYLNEDRPVKVDNCTGIDDYKYGLSSGLPDYVEMDPIGGREAIFQRGMGRTLNFVIGSEDYGPGDIRCQAEAQGKNHRQRARLWKENIEAKAGSWPNNWSYNYAPTCKHDDQCIFNSDAGLQHLFRDGFAAAASAVELASKIVVSSTSQIASIETPSSSSKTTARAASSAKTTAKTSKKSSATSKKHSKTTSKKSSRPTSSSHKRSKRGH